MARCSRRHIDGAPVALTIYAVVCCAVTVCLALGLYELMQPRRFANPGLAAYKPPPGTVINLVGVAPPAPAPEITTESIEPPAPEITTASTEPPAQTLDISASQRQTKPKTANAKPERPKRQRAARLKQRRDPMMGYAFQPSFGSYRFW
jgi:hypothetical protein